MESRFLLLPMTGNLTHQTDPMDVGVHSSTSFSPEGYKMAQWVKAYLAILTTGTQSQRPTVEGKDSQKMSSANW